MHTFRRQLHVAVLACGSIEAGSAAAQQPRTHPAMLESLLTVSAPPDPRGVLALDDALRLSARHHPALQGAAWRLRAAAARRRDAGRWSNPSAALDVENFAGEVGSRRREITASLGQVIDLGGDRAARVHAAQASEQLAWTELTAEERRVLTATSERFLDAWTLQEKLGRLARAEQLAAQAIEAANERFRAGAGPAVERIKAEAVLANRQAERVRARAELRAAWQRLISQWGATDYNLDSLALDVPARVRIPQPAELVTRLQQHPERLRAAAEVAFEEARLREMRAARVPDLEVSAGFRHLAEEETVAMVAGISIPLPLWGTQRASAEAAEAEREAASARERLVRLRLQEELRSAYERSLAAGEAHELIVDRVRPKAEEVLRQVSAGYRGGRFSSLELLDAQRSLLEADVAWVEATVEAWRARAALEHLIGEPLGRIDAGEEGR
ncbi:MAG TPA: TolC family protein [Candidatus Limnocylindria bacterium]|nr:TolC family protein [Candidatus Limnocylindria bacterium]